jgi:hypothetical protein
VPTIAEERFRDLLRCREDLRGDLMRARHRLAKLLPTKRLRFSSLGPSRNHCAAHSSAPQDPPPSAADRRIEASGARSLGRRGCSPGPPRRS